MRKIRGFIQHQASAGFTLIELVLVVAIVGIISTMGITSFIGTQGRARDAQRKNDLGETKKALELYRYDSQGGAFYPSQANLPSLANPPRSYIKRIPNDPKTGTAYSYTPSPAGCGSDCTGYTLCATLERPEDPDIKAGAATVCPNSSYGNYGFTNP